MTLFPDSETFQKDRPQNITKSQRDELIEKLANECIEDGYSTSDLDYIMADLDSIFPFYMDGFDMAKDLERANAEYNIDSRFVEWLEGLRWEYRQVKDTNIKTWVSAHSIKPQFETGIKLHVEKGFLIGIGKGSIIYVTGIISELGQYTVHGDPNYKGGIISEFEKVEANCSISK